MNTPDNSFQNALEVLRSLPPNDHRVLDACRKLGEITNDLQSAMASETSLKETCDILEERSAVTAKHAASFMIEILRLAHNL